MHECAKWTPQEQTQSRPLADSERTPSGAKFLKSGLEADPKRTQGPLLGSALVLGCVRSVL